MRDPQERIKDMLEAIERIEHYASRGRSQFEQDERIESRFTRDLQILGEAATIPGFCGSARRDGVSYVRLIYRPVL